jgi:hypothetical protein
LNDTIEKKIKKIIKTNDLSQHGYLGLKYSLLW